MIIYQQKNDINIEFIIKGLEAINNRNNRVKFYNDEIINFLNFI